jgi:hypothetical protein
MTTQQVLQEVEKTIKYATRKIRKKDELPCPDILLAAGKLVNSYRKLLEVKGSGTGSESTDSELGENWDDGDPTYHAKLERGDLDLLNARRRLKR